MVENTRGGPSPYESLHTPFQTAQKQSTARLASKPSPHLPIQKTHSPSHRGRCPYVPGRPCPTLTYLQTPRRLGEGTAILKFLHGQYYTGKLALRYGHAPSDTCQLCGLPDSCTHVAGECPAHTDHIIISKHNAACQLTHSTIRKAFKGGGALYSPHTLQLVSADAGTKSQTTGPLLKSLGSASSAPPEFTGDQEDWLDPPHDDPEPQQPRRHPRHVDVSKDVKDLLRLTLPDR